MNVLIAFLFEWIMQISKKLPPLVSSIKYLQLDSPEKSWHFSPSLHPPSGYLLPLETFEWCFEEWTKCCDWDVMFGYYCYPLRYVVWNALDMTGVLYFQIALMAWRVTSSDWFGDLHASIPPAGAERLKYRSYDREISLLWRIFLRRGIGGCYLSGGDILHIVRLSRFLRSLFI